MSAAVPKGQAPVAVLCAAWPFTMGSRMLSAAQPTLVPSFSYSSFSAWAMAPFPPWLLCRTFCSTAESPLAGEGVHWQPCPQDPSLSTSTTP